MARPGTGIVVRCNNCEKPKRVSPSRLARRKRQYCGKGCYLQWLRTNRSKINSHLKRRVRLKCLHCKSEFEVHAYRKETARYCSYSCNGKAHNGERASNWRGGVTPQHRVIRASVRMRCWREAVFIRDNYTCQKCRARGRRLNADHIKSFAQFPHLRFAVSNGRTLCETCHRRTPNFGRRAVIS